MTTVMLNVRLDKNLKTAGERVLAKQGLGATDAVRGLYRYLEQTDDIPDFCKPENDGLSPEVRRQKMRSLIGVAKLSPGEDLKSLRAERLRRIRY